MNHLKKFSMYQESHTGKLDSSITKEEARSLINQIYQYKDSVSGNQSLEQKCKDRLYYYDTMNVEFVIDSIFYNDVTEEDIIKMGDTLMDKFGTEPQMLEQAFEDCFSVFTSEGIYTADDEEFEEMVEEKAKSSRYKGRKIPGKYLTGPHSGKMKKEIDRYRGKSEYKKDWDADYDSGKGGVGKRVKTKESEATKAYKRMFGESKINEGLMTWLIGGGVAIMLVRFIIRTLKYRGAYKTLTSSLIQMVKQESGLKTLEGDERVQVTEYDDRYYVVFKSEKILFTDIRVSKTDRVLTFDFRGRTVKLHLSEDMYDEFVGIIKTKL